MGPVNSRLATGLCWSARPLRPRCTAAATASTASGCPSTALPKASARPSSFCRSSMARLPAGIPVRVDTTPAMSAAVTVLPRRFPEVRVNIRCIRSRSSAAFSKRLSRTASLSSISRDCFSCSYSPFSLRISSSLALAAPSSKRSMALSGKNCSGKYRRDRSTAASSASSVIFMW